MFKVIKDALHPINYKEDKLAIRGYIRMQSRKGISAYSLSKELNMDPKTVRRWRNHSNGIFNKKHNRKSIFIPAIYDRAIELAKDKLTGVDKASAFQISKQLRREFGLFTRTPRKRMVSKWLRKFYGPALRIRHTFVLTEKHKLDRKKFTQMIIENEIKGKDIMFTDEKKFVLTPHFNKSTNKIRLSEESRQGIKDGKPSPMNLLFKQVNRKEISLMVGAGITYYGPTPLIFCVGNEDGFSYQQMLNIYDEEMGRIQMENHLGKDLIFQQDNARPHTSNQSKALMNLTFNEERRIEWPPHSPDLSPIELLGQLLIIRFQSFNAKI